MKKGLTLVLSCLLLGCAGDPYADSRRLGMPSPSIGMLPNRFARNSDLAAVCVVQASPNPFDRMGFASALRPPSAIWYAFWDGRVYQVQYTPSGNIADRFWWPPRARLKPGSAGWGGFDFSYGSDPTFLRHRDPRLTAAPTPASATR